MAWSCEETTYQEGMVFHAAAETDASKTEPARGFCVAAIMLASESGRSLQNASWELCPIDVEKTGRVGDQGAIEWWLREFLARLTERFAGLGRECSQVNESLDVRVTGGCPRDHR